MKQVDVLDKKEITTEVFRSMVIESVDAAIRLDDLEYGTTVLLQGSWDDCYLIQAGADKITIRPIEIKEA